MSFILLIWIDEKKKEKCDNRYDDFMICQNEYGYNDLKCRRNLKIHYHKVKKNRFLSPKI